MGRKRIGMKRMGIDLVGIGFDEELGTYHTETLFKCRDMDNVRTLVERATILESSRNCSITLMDDGIHLTDYFTPEEFERLYSSLVNVAKEGKCPERLDPLATAIESDACMVEEDADRVAFFLGASGEEYDRMFSSINNHIKEGMDS